MKDLRRMVVPLKGAGS